MASQRLLFGCCGYLYQPEENMSEKHIVIVGAGLVSILKYSYAVFFRRLGGKYITFDIPYIDKIGLFIHKLLLRKEIFNEF